MSTVDIARGEIETSGGFACVGADALIGPPIRLTKLGCIVEQYIKTIPGVTAYVVMPNHVHLVIAIEDGNGPMLASAPTQSLGTRVRSFKTLTGKAAGFSLWQRSYYDHVIRNTEDELRILEYIQTNPARRAEDEYYQT